jgi:hypothetical protein
MAKTLIIQSTVHRTFLQYLRTRFTTTITSVLIMRGNQRRGRATAFGVPEMPPFGRYLRAVIGTRSVPIWTVWPKKELTLKNGNQLMSGLMSERGKKFLTTMIKFRVMHPARSHSPKLGIPTCPQPFLASSQRNSTGFPADPEALARHAGNTSRQTLRHTLGTPAAHSGTHSGITPAPRQHFPAHAQTLSRHPGNTSRHMIRHYCDTPAPWHIRQHFPAHAQTPFRHPGNISGHRLRH